MDSDQIVDMIDKMEKECHNIKNEALQFAWYMRGGLSYETALMLSEEERKAIGKIVKDNFETTKKTGLPYF